VLALSLFVSACGSGEEAEYPDNVIGVGEVDGREPASAPRPKGVLYRDEVDETVDIGLGYFLQRVDVEPALDNGHFKGFRIAALRPPDWWEGVDLEPGDVILSVNGMPIERDTQAHKAFLSLKQASELRVEYLRGGQSRTLVYRILPRQTAKRPPS
jgi:S1-C subfamily serine protease